MLPPRTYRYERRVAWLGLVALAVVVLLSLSDSVPHYYAQLATHLPPDVRRSPLLSFSSPWGLHFVAFTVLSFLATQAARSWRARFGLAAGLMACGWAIEVGQAAFSSIRSYQGIDLMADARGIVVGFTAAVCLVTLRSQFRPRDERINVLPAKNLQRQPGSPPVQRDFA